MAATPSITSLCIHIVAKACFLASITWVVVSFGDDILTEGLGLKALTRAIPRKRVWPVTVLIKRILATA
jgi:hypothetical protein